MPELVRDGVNGRLVATTAEAVEAVATVRGLSPATVRGSVSERFSADRMVDDYVALYRRILGEGAGKPTP
jgi:hypothetical protein